MEHPQPAFDLLTSLPIENPVEENVFVDWYAYETVDAEKGDDIASHPEIWEKLELPTELSELVTEDFVSLQPFSGELNLNAFAVGLGLENIEYEPEVFAGLVYHPPVEYDATAFLFQKDVLMSVGETAEATRGTLEFIPDRLGELGLDDEIEFESILTDRVSAFM